MTVADGPDTWGNNFSRVHVTITRTIHMNRRSVSVVQENRLNDTLLHLPRLEAHFEICKTAEPRVHFCQRCGNIDATWALRGA